MTTQLDETPGTRRRRGRPSGHGPGFEARRNEVIDAATKLFAERGYSGTTVSDLAQTTGLGKGALYNYIESKENLLVEISALVMTPLIATMREIVQLDEGPLVRLRMVSEAILDGIAQRPEHVWVYEHDYRYLTGKNRERFLDQRHEFEGLAFQLGRAAVEQGLFRKTDLRLLLFQFFNLHKQTAQWFHLGGRWTPADLSREYCRTLFNGFAADADTFDAIEARVEAHRAKASETQ